MSQKGIQRTVIFICAFMALVLGLFINKFLQPRILSVKEMVNNNAIIFSTPREISPLNLTDQNNQPFTNANFNGKWTLVFFGFTHCPDICPTTLATFRDLAAQLEETSFHSDTAFLLVSLDPARDTPEVIKPYIEFFSPDFNAVTGEFLDIHRFAKQLNVPFQKVTLSEDSYTIDHGGNIALINPEGFYQGFFKAPITLGQLALTYKSVRLSNK